MSTISSREELTRLFPPRLLKQYEHYVRTLSISNLGYNIRSYVIRWWRSQEQLYYFLEHGYSIKKSRFRRYCATELTCFTSTPILPIYPVATIHPSKGFRYLYYNLEFWQPTIIEDIESTVPTEFELYYRDSRYDNNIVRIVAYRNYHKKLELPPDTLYIELNHVKIAWTMWSMAMFLMSTDSTCFNLLMCTIADYYNTLVLGIPLKLDVKTVEALEDMRKENDFNEISLPDIIAECMLFLERIEESYILTRDTVEKAKNRFLKEVEATVRALEQYYKVELSF